MSGFKKNLSSSQFSNKTISSGIKSFDELIEMVPSSVTCIYEDEYSLIHNTLLQVMYSSFSTEKKTVKIYSKEEKNCIKFERFISQGTSGSDPNKSDPILIAWRYKNLDLNNSVQNWSLLNKIPIEKDNQINDINILLEHMKNTKNEHFVVFSLFSADFLCFDEMNSILFDIKKYCRMNNHTVVLSLPQFLFKDLPSNYFDSIFKISNNLTLPHEVPLYCSFIEIIKFGKPGTILVSNLESFKYGILLKSKNIRIERIDVPPEEMTVKEGCSSNNF